ncbi:Uncharacterised protein [uncultured archaeon]|nr:Uncharacterised protein [uncultured archaeon]
MTSLPDKAFNNKNYSSVQLSSNYLDPNNSDFIQLLKSRKRIGNLQMVNFGLNHRALTDYNSPYLRSQYVNLSDSIQSGDYLLFTELPTKMIRIKSFNPSVLNTIALKRLLLFPEKSKEVEEYANKKNNELYEEQIKSGRQIPRRFDVIRISEGFAKINGIEKITISLIDTVVNMLKQIEKQNIEFIHNSNVQIRKLIKNEIQQGQIDSDVLLVLQMLQDNPNISIERITQKLIEESGFISTKVNNLITGMKNAGIICLDDYNSISVNPWYKGFR